MSLTDQITAQAAIVLALHDSEVGLLREQVVAVVTDIWQETGRVFDTPTSATTQYLAAPIGAYLPIGDLSVDTDHPVTITAWGTPLVVGVDVDLVWDRTGSVVIALERLGPSGAVQAWTAGQTVSGRRAIAVTGWWGWLVPPATVVASGVMIACRLWQARDQDYSDQSGIAAVGSRGAAAPSLLPPVVKSRLSPWVRAAAAAVSEG